MGKIIKLDDKFVIAQASIVRNINSSKEDIKKALFLLGQEIGKKFVENYYLEEREITTPMNESISSLLPKFPLSVIITTRDDTEHLRKGLASILDNCKLGYMDFEGRRGLEALNSSVRMLQLPEIKNKVVDSLIIGKAVLATGCTAISLTKTAIKEYLPKRLIITTIFYSRMGLSELIKEFPHADIFVVGEPDDINEDGMLVPGVGNLDERLRV